MTSRASQPATVSRGLLIGVAAAALLVWHVIPFGRQLLYPITLFSTWVHEMGHGLTAIAVGGRFHELAIHADASGSALSSRPEGAGALVALGGLLAPPIAAAAMLVFARTPGRARFALLVLSAAMLASAVLWTRTAVGLIAVPLLALAFAFLAWRGGRATLFGAQALAMMLVLLTVTRMDYLFTAGAVVDGERRVSDIGTVAEQFGGHHLLWGVPTAALSIALCLGGLWVAWRGGRRSEPASPAPQPS